MNFTRLTLHTPVPHVPLVVNTNFDEVQRYLDVFYDPSMGVVTVPVQTSGRVKAAKGEFVTAVVDNLVVRQQFTNQLENVNTVDVDYYNAFVGPAVVPRDPSTWENPSYDYVDVQKAYYKIVNDQPIAFRTDTLGQQIEIIFDEANVGVFDILLDPISPTRIEITPDANLATSLTLIAVGYDPSYGTTWHVRSVSGNYQIL